MLGHRMMMAAMIKSSAPVNTVAPAVTGSASVGSVLSCTTGTWTGTPTPTYTYQWQHGTTNISGQTASTYTAESAYAGETIRCVVTATNSVSAVAANSNSTAALTWGPINTVAPAVTGTTPTVGDTLTTTNGTWTGSPAPTYTYQWQHGTTNISGKTSSTYVTESAYAGETIRCVVTATNSTGAVAANSNATSALTWVPINTVAPAVTGTTPTVGDTLSCTTGTWTGYPTPTITYQWQHGTTNISGKTSSTYVTEIAYAGETIRCVVTGTNSVGNASANSNATSALIGYTYITATGGDTIATDGNYKVHSFTTSGTFTVSSVGTDPTVGNVVDILVIAGGGGGAGTISGNGGGGGGGAGGYCEQTGRTVTATGYTCTVGGGGGGGTGNEDSTGNGTNGSNSVFGAVTALGGGGGGKTNNTAAASNGGSGGGQGSDGANYNSNGTATQGNSDGATGYGYNGGDGNSANGGGGGGGAGAIGVNCTGNDGLNKGGAGRSSSITGSAVTRASGGGGASLTGSAAVAGGGGAGGGQTGGDSAGTANTGGGGGGGARNTYVGKAGGSGVVIVRYKFQ